MGLIPEEGPKRDHPGCEVSLRSGTDLSYLIISGSHQCRIGSGLGW